MKVLLVGAGGVGGAIASLTAERPFVETMVVADYDLSRARLVAEQANERAGKDRFRPAQVDAANREAVAELLAASDSDVLMNACDPRFVMPLFDAAFSARVTYLDMAMSLSHANSESPYTKPGVMLGDDQFKQDAEWRERDLLAIVGIGVEPGLSDVFARYAADELFERLDEVGVRDGADLVVQGYQFAPTFSIWTTIEECLNPPLVYERDRGWFTTAPFSEPEVFDFPEGIGPLECVNVEHEEVVLMPRWLDVGRVTFKYGLGSEFIDVLRTLHKLGLDSTGPVTVNGMAVSPRDVVAACLPDPATLGDRMHGRTCAGTWIRGRGKNGRPRQVYLYQVADNDESMRRWGSQAVVWQTAVNPVAALEMLDSGAWTGAGLMGPEAFPPRPFLDAISTYGANWSVREEEPER